MNLIFQNRYENHSFKITQKNKDAWADVIEFILYDHFDEYDKPLTPEIEELESCIVTRWDPNRFIEIWQQLDLNSMEYSLIFIP